MAPDGRSRIQELGPFLLYGLLLVALWAAMLFSCEQAGVVGVFQQQWEAERFAEGKDQNACVEEAFRRLDAQAVEGGASDVAGTLYFLQPCLDSAAESPQLCTRVRASSEAADAESKAKAFCDHYGKAFLDCLPVFMAVSNECGVSPESWE